MTVGTRLFLVFAVAVALLGRNDGATAQDGASWSVVQADVRVLCPMTVGGSFEAKTRSLRGTVALARSRPPVFTGALIVDLRTLETGIGLRDDHLRDKYLEVDRGEGFESAVLSDIQLGEVDAHSFQGRTGFKGTLLLHGTKQAITGQADIHRQGAAVRMEVSFPVTLAAYGIPKPQYVGVGVKDQVVVNVSLVAAPVLAPAAGSQ
jgi:hypothetical protein